MAVQLKHNRLWGKGRVFLSALFSEQTLRRKGYDFRQYNMRAQVLLSLSFLSTNSAVVGFWSPPTLFHTKMRLKIEYKYK